MTTALPSNSPASPRYKRVLLKLSGEALGGELVGITEIENASHIVRFCGRDLGVIGRDFRFHRFAPPRARLRSAMETERGTD